MPLLDALIVAHGQPSAPKMAEEALADFRQKVAKHAPEVCIGSATLAARGSLEGQLANLRPNAPVYPLFMSDGWFVKTNLANRLKTASVEMMTAFGKDPSLPKIAAMALADRLTPGSAPLLLVAHGSASGRAAPSQATEQFARTMSTMLGAHPVKVGYIEQNPHIRDVARHAPEAALCLPFLAMEGAHLRNDVRIALDQAGFVGDLLPPISHLPGVAQHIADTITAALDGDRLLPKAACA